MNMDNIIVKYRYVVTMSDRYKLYPLVLDDWLHEKFDMLYNGKLGFLVCPYFTPKDDKEHIYCQLLLDVEGKVGTEKAFDYSKSMLNRYSFLTMEYTGKTGFHLASNFLVKVPKESSPQIRKLMLEPLQLSSLVDQNSSIRNMPTIRIGTFGKRFAYPIQKNMNYKQFTKLTFIAKDFSQIMSKQQLQDYIKEYILPDKIINYKQYLDIVR